MKTRKYLFLAAGLLSLLVFSTYLTQSEPQKFFGMQVSVWVVRVSWLILGLLNFLNFHKLYKK